VKDKRQKIKDERWKVKVRREGFTLCSLCCFLCVLRDPAFKCRAPTLTACRLSFSGGTSFGASVRHSPLKELSQTDIHIKRLLAHSEVERKIGG
jgi:hypothetical protein